jgi:DNA-binding response OmpR family regulator
MTSNKTALIVDDTEANRFFFERLLQQAGYTIHSAATGSQANQVLDEEDDLALAILDVEIGDSNGLDLTKRIRAKHEETCIVIASMHDERAIMSSAFSKGCDIYLVKPNGFVDLFKRLTTLANGDLRAGTPLIMDQYGVRRYVAES